MTDVDPNVYSAPVNFSNKFTILVGDGITRIVFGEDVNGVAVYSQAVILSNTNAQAFINVLTQLLPKGEPDVPMAEK